MFSSIYYQDSSKTGGATEHRHASSLQNIVTVSSSQVSASTWTDLRHILRLRKPNNQRIRYCRLMLQPSWAMVQFIFAQFQWLWPTPGLPWLWATPSNKARLFHPKRGLSQDHARAVSCRHLNHHEGRATHRAITSEAAPRFRWRPSNGAIRTSTTGFVVGSQHLRRGK